MDSVNCEEDYTQNFTYDSLGNITSFPDNGEYDYAGNTGTSYANPHAVTSLPDIGLAVNYDHNGNLTSEVWQTYTIFSATWDYNNRLVSNTSLNDPASYAYDHTGQRIKQDINSGGDVTVYPNKYYNVDTQGETSKVTEHIYDNKGNLLLTAENDGTNLTLHYDHTDHLGGSSVMTDGDGVTEQIIDYYPFGQMRFNQKETNFDEQRKHTGHEYDGNTDLTYMNARYYAGVAGRFVSEDQAFLDLGNGDMTILLNPQMLNSYSYALNSPIVNVDRDGKTPGSFALVIAYLAMHQFVTHTPNIPHSIREADFIVSHPVAAAKIGTAKDSSTSNLSSIASNFAVNLTQPWLGYSGNQSLEGTERNALRHTVWQGILTNSLGSNTAEQAGNSHEYNPFANLSNRSFSDMGLADQSADLLNNQIGRDIASNNKGLSSQQIAQKSLDYFHDVGLYTVQNPSQGVFNVTQTRISDTQYNNSSKALSNLGNNGLSQ